jgi:alpha-tubulin suppressor-like RCC1 family protein
MQKCKFKFDVIDNRQLGLLNGGGDVATAVNVHYSLFKKVVKNIAAAAYSSYCVTSNGAVYSWGKNDVGQLGTGDTTWLMLPKVVTLPSETYITKIFTAKVGSIFVMAASGIIYCWGYNSNGQLGDGTTTHRYSPVAMNITLPAGSNILALSTGGSSTMIILNGTFCYGILSTEPIVCSGKGICSANDTCSCNEGYLGNKCQVTQCFGVLSNATASVCSGKGSCIAYNSCYCNPTYIGTLCNITTRGYVYTIGDNTLYQVGDREQLSTLLSTPTKTQYPLLYGNYITQILSGYDSTLALSSAGDVYGWGLNYYGTLGRDPTVTGILNEPVLLTQTGQKFSTFSSNLFHTALIDASGYIYTLGWGSARYAGSSPPNNCQLQCLSGATLVTCSSTTCSCNANEGVKIGNLGNSSYYYTYTPVYVSVPGNPVFTQISAGLYHTVAITSTGLVYGFGRANEGQLGDGLYAQNPSTMNSFYTSPYLVGGSTDFGSWMMGRKAVAAKAGDFHTLVLLDRGELVAFGLNNRGQLGDGTQTNKYLPSLYLPSVTTTPIISISAGCQASFIVTSAGTVLSFGANYNNVLGLNISSTSANITTPTPVSNISDAYVVQSSFYPVLTTALTDYLVPTSTSVLVFTRNGSLYGMGANNRGMLGDGTTITRSTPTAFIVDKPTRYVTQMYPAYRHTSLLFSSSYWCYNILPDDPAVCGYGRGSCVANNTCVCRTGYSGNECTTPICFDIIASSNKTCSGNGFCTEVDFCVCYPGYSGLNCSAIAQDFVFAAGHNDVGQLGDGPLNLVDRRYIAQSQLLVKKTYNFATGGDAGAIVHNAATGEIGMI